MKVSISVITFEVMKQYHKEKYSNILTNFRVPFNIEEIYVNFHSLNYQARRAMKSLYQYYTKNKTKIEFFNGIIGYKNYRLYAEKVFSLSKELKNNC